MKKVIGCMITLFFGLSVQAQNVGVGTTTPQEKLDVNGNVNIVGTIKANSVAGVNGQVLMSTGAGLTWGSLSGFTHAKSYITGGSYTFTVPVGVTEIMVEVWGGGGGSNGYVGGNSGGYVRAVVPVVAGNTVSGTVGNASSGVVMAGTGAGAAGNNSTANITGGYSITALGGSAGTASGTLNSNIGAPGIPTSGTVSGFSASASVFMMYGNTGSANAIQYMQKSSTEFVKRTLLGKGGRPPGFMQMIENTEVVGSSSSSNSDFTSTPFGQVESRPATGGSNLCDAQSNTCAQAGGPGMVIIWWK